MAAKRTRTTEAKPTDRFARRAHARRRVGIGARCRCGERRAATLVTKSNPKICQKCQRAAQQKSTLDDHHVAGESNDPTTVKIPTNDHVAELTDRQRDWPEQTLRNPDRDPLLKGAACIRGVRDTIVYLVDGVILWIAHMLEAASAWLTDTLGRRYWYLTPLEAFAPGR